MEMDRVPLWRGDHVAVKQLAEDFASYLYLPRLKGSFVLADAIRDGLGLMFWHHESYAYADSLDEATGRYRALRGGEKLALADDALFAGLLVKPEVAQRQMDAEKPGIDPVTPPGSTPHGPGPTPSPKPGPGIKPLPIPAPKRFHGTVTLDPTRVGRDASRIAEDVVAHFAGLVGAKVTVTLELDAEIPSGASDQLVRTVTENSRTLKFTSHGFEDE